MARDLEQGDRGGAWVAQGQGPKPFRLWRRREEPRSLSGTLRTLKGAPGEGECHGPREEGLGIPQRQKKKKRLGGGKPGRKDKEMGPSRRSYMKNSSFGEGEQRRQKSSKKFMTTSTFWVEGHRVPGTVSARRLGSLVADPSCLTSHLCVPEGRTPDMAHLNWVFPVNGLSVYVPLKCIC